MLKAFCTLLFVSLVGFVFAQMGNTAPEVKLVFPASAKAGQKVQGTIEITFAEGLHGYQNPPSEAYQIPVKVSLDTKGYKLVKVAYPKGIAKATGGETKPSNVYEGTIRIPVTVEMPKKPGAAVFKLTISYQQCNDETCFPPSSVTGTAKLKVVK